MIPTLYEGKRGCGYRKAGGIYLVSDGFLEPCSALPMPLEVCPTCHAGVHPTRGWTWVDPKILLGLPRGPHPPEQHYERCPFSQLDGLGLGERAGLLWIGEKFYKTPQEFTAEAMKLGASRRIKAVPHGFELGQWVILAHRKAFSFWQAYAPGGPESEPEPKPGVFHAFRPSRIEYVVKGTGGAAGCRAVGSRI